MVMNAYAVPGIIERRKFFATGNIQKAEKIIENICDFLQCKVKRVKGKSRIGEIVYCRQWCIWFCSTETALSSKKLGEIFGGRDHTTILHNREAVKAQLYGAHPNQYKEDYSVIANVALSGVQKGMDRLPKRISYRKNSSEKPVETVRPQAVYSNTDFSKEYV